MTAGKRRIFAGIAAVLLASVLCDWLYLRYHAKGRYSRLSAAAKTVGLAAEEWLSEGHSPAELAGEHCVAEQDAFGAYLNGLESPYLRENDHYAVVCGADGQVRYVLYSFSRIADSDPERPPVTDMFTSVHTLQIPLFWRFTVVCYP